VILGNPGEIDAYRAGIPRPPKTVSLSRTGAKNGPRSIGPRKPNEFFPGSDSAGQAGERDFMAEGTAKRVRGTSRADGDIACSDFTTRVRFTFKPALSWQRRRR